MATAQQAELTFAQMLERDLALGTGLTYGEDLGARYAGIEGAYNPGVTITPETTPLPLALPLDIGGSGPIDVLAGIASGYVSGGVAGAVTGGLSSLATGGGNVTTDMTLFGSAGVGNYYGFSGPGVQEPPVGTYSKTWKQKVVQGPPSYGNEYWVYYWRMNDGYTVNFNPRTGAIKRWRPRKNIVISSDPRISTIRKAERATYGAMKKLAKKSRFLSMSKGR